jgi:hypothetical protein
MLLCIRVIAEEESLRTEFKGFERAQKKGLA